MHLMMRRAAVFCLSGMLRYSSLRVSVMFIMQIRRNDPANTTHIPMGIPMYFMCVLLLVCICAVSFC